MLSFEDRLLQLERLERWCCTSTLRQQLRATLPIALFLGIVAGLIAGLAPYPTPDEACEIMASQVKIQPGASLLPTNFSACPRRPEEEAAGSQVVNRARSGGRISSGPQTELALRTFSTRSSIPRSLADAVLIPGDSVYRRGDTKGQSTLRRTDAAPSD